MPGGVADYICKFPGIKLHSTFIWIVEQKKSSTTIGRDVRQTRTTLQVKKQEHKQVYLLVGASERRIQMYTRFAEGPGAVRVH